MEHYTALVESRYLAAALQHCSSPEPGPSMAALLLLLGLTAGAAARTSGADTYYYLVLLGDLLFHFLHPFTFIKYIGSNNYI